MTQTNGTVATGRILLAVGIVLALLARGADVILVRDIVKANAAYQSARHKLQDQYDVQIAETSDTEKKMKLQREQSAERTYLEATEWLPLEQARDMASLRARKYGFFTEILFVLGSICLLGGALQVGFGSEGTERIVSLVLIGLITASIYIVGTAWVGSIKRDAEATGAAATSRMMRSFP